LTTEEGITAMTQLGLRGVLFALLVGLSGSLVAQPTQAVAEQAISGINLPVNTLEPKDFVRHAGGSVVPYANLMSDRNIVITFTFKTARSDDIVYLEETYGLKAKTVEGLPQGVRLFSFQNATPPEAITGTINKIMKDAHIVPYVLSVSPLFSFSDGYAYVRDQVVITWATTDTETRVNNLKSCGLSVVSYDEKTGIMIARTTTASGWNVFKLAHLCGPHAGVPFTKSSEPLWVDLTPPVTITARVEPDNGLGYPADIVGSVFRFVLDIHAQESAKVNFNELSVSSSELHGWFPQRVGDEGKLEPISPQVFDLIGPEIISDPVVLKDNSTVTTVVYRFRVSQAGTFYIGSPKVLYEYTNSQLQNTAASEYVGGSLVEFKVASVLTEDADMVNGVMVRKPLHVETTTLLENAARTKKVSLLLFALGAVFLGFATRHGVAAYLCKDRTVDVSALSPDERWEQVEESILAHLPADPPAFWTSFNTNILIVLDLFVKKFAETDVGALTSLSPDEAKKICLAALPQEAHEELETLFAEYKKAYETRFNEQDYRYKTFSLEGGKALVELVRDKLIVAHRDIMRRTGNVRH
jgi:hypothetical protein